MAGPRTGRLAGVSRREISNLFFNALRRRGRPLPARGYWHFRNSSLKRTTASRQMLPFPQVRSSAGLRHADQPGRCPIPGGRLEVSGPLSNDAIAPERKSTPYLTGQVDAYDKLHSLTARKSAGLR